MPAWLVSFVLNFLLPMALKLGMPAFYAWLKKKLPWLPINQVTEILDEHVKEMGDVTTAKKVSRRKVRNRLAEKLAKRPIQA